MIRRKLELHVEYIFEILATLCYIMMLSHLTNTLLQPAVHAYVLSCFSHVRLSVTHGLWSARLR